MADPYIGQIILFAGNYAPPGWAFCNGQTLQIQSNPALYAVIGMTYGGDGRTTFNLPDLRGRVPVHFGSGTGLSNYGLGDQGGVETVALNLAQLPTHNHTFSATGATATLQAGDGFGTSPTPNGNYLCNAGDPQGSQGLVSVNFSPAAQAGTLSAVAGLSLNMGPGAIGTSGSGAAHPNLQPFLALNFIIATEGLYPSRS